MSTKFMVNGKEKELSYKVNGIDISADFIGNNSHGMTQDGEGCYVASEGDFEWWQNTIASHQEMSATIAAYKEVFDPDEVDQVVQDWIDTDLDNQPAQVLMGLEKAFGSI